MRMRMMKGVLSFGTEQRKERRQIDREIDRYLTSGENVTSVRLEEIWKGNARGNEW